MIGFRSGSGSRRLSARVLRRQAIRVRPHVDLAFPEAPRSADFESRDLPGGGHSIDRPRFDLQVLGHFADREDFSAMRWHGPAPLTAGSSAKYSKKRKNGNAVVGASLCSRPSRRDGLHLCRRMLGAATKQPHNWSLAGDWEYRVDSWWGIRAGVLLAWLAVRSRHTDHRLRNAPATKYRWTGLMHSTARRHSGSPGTP